MKKLKPNYIVFFIIMITTSCLLIFVSYLLDVLNPLQLMMLILSPFFLTFLFKYNNDTSSLGFFFNEKEIILKTNNEEIITQWSDVIIAKGFFNSKLILKNKKCIDLLFYEKDLLLQYTKMHQVASNN